MITFKTRIIEFSLGFTHTHCVLQKNNMLLLTVMIYFLFLIDFFCLATCSYTQIISCQFVQLYININALVWFNDSGLNVHIISLSDGKAKHVFGHYIDLLHINLIHFHFSRVTLWVGKMLWWWWDHVLCWVSLLSTDFHV